MENEVILATIRLLRAIDESDWETYASLCEENLTCFEPEACGQLVGGLDFHKTYFGSEKGVVKSTICRPHVVALSETAFMIAYSRLVQIEVSEGGFKTAQFEETRIWRKGAGGWKLIHLHRSRNEHGS